MSRFGDELLWDACTEAVAPIADLEHEWDSLKLAKKIRDYFRRGAKGLLFGRKPWDQLVNDYADAVFGSLFTSLADREWLTEADLLLVLDAAIKDTFPPHILAQVPQYLFERTVLAAHDRAFEEQRYLLILWKVCQETVPGDKSRKKVYNAGEAGRKEAVNCPRGELSANVVEDFAGRWINKTIGALGKSTQGELEWTLPEQLAVQWFHTLVEAGALPLGLVRKHGHPPRGWRFVDETVHQAYLAHSTSALIGRLRPWPGPSGGAAAMDFIALPDCAASAHGSSEEGDGWQPVKRLRTGDCT